MEVKVAVEVEVKVEVMGVEVMGAGVMGAEGDVEEDVEGDEEPPKITAPQYLPSFFHKGGANSNASSVVFRVCTGIFRFA